MGGGTQASCLLTPSGEARSFLPGPWPGLLAGLPRRPTANSLPQSLSCGCLPPPSKQSPNDKALCPAKVLTSVIYVRCLLRARLCARHSEGGTKSRRAASSRESARHTQAVGLSTRAQREQSSQGQEMEAGLDGQGCTGNPGLLPPPGGCAQRCCGRGCEYLGDPVSRFLWMYLAALPPRCGRCSHGACPLPRVLPAPASLLREPETHLQPQPFLL